MSAPIYLMLVFHNHQPVSQFDHVNEHSTHVSYLPLIELLERHPMIRVGMHYSGPLLEWLKVNHGSVVNRLRTLVARGQVEIISGGFYEPVLAALPDEDKIGQIQKMNAEIQAVFGVEPSGMWVAERIWEPYLARPIAQANIRYIMLDDTHFENVGFNRENELFGYFMTEEQGAALAVFPILAHLRYSIPWEPVETLIEWLREQADQPLANGLPKVALMGDDGEKFGTWPGTYAHCWGENKYMERLFTTIERNSDWLRTATPSEFIAGYGPLGRVYLPTASYSEMGVWSLPPDSSRQMMDLQLTLKRSRRTDILRYMRAGLWRNFMVKYDEINHMHKRMLMVSEKVHNMRKGRKRDQALELLWAAQGNDPYWHGIFGGIYLFKFRVATYMHLLAAENAADGDDLALSLSQFDFDRDGRDDIALNGNPLNAIWNPAQGGALLELDYRPATHNLLNIMTRRKEAYHADLLNAAASGTLIVPMPGHHDSSEASTSETVFRATEPGLEHKLVYDWHRRASFLDHFIAPSTTLDEFYRAQYAEQGDFVNQPYEVSDLACDGKQARLTLRRNGYVWIGDVLHPVTLQKEFSTAYGSPALTVRYTLSNPGDEVLELRFGVETVVGFDGGQNLHYCSLRINENGPRESLANLREIEAVTSHAADSNLRNLTLKTTLSKPAFLWQFPLETVTLSVAGFERGYQGTVFLHVWNIRLAPNETWQVTLTQSVQQTATRPSG